MGGGVLTFCAGPTGTLSPKCSRRAVWVPVSQRKNAASQASSPGGGPRTGQHHRVGGASLVLPW